MDVYAEQIDENSLPGFEEPYRNYECDDESIDHTIEMLNQAERPLLILGHGAFGIINDEVKGELNK